MAARKDFASKKRRTAAPKSKTASPKASSATAQASAEQYAAPPAKKRPFKVIVASLVSIAIIVLVLQQLMSVDPREIRESGITALIEQKIGSGNSPVVEATEPTAVVTATPAQNKPKQKSATKSNTEATVKAVKSSIPVTDISTVAEKKEPFQFYKILAQDTVETETIAAYKSTPKTAKLKKKTLLQTGSFRQQKDAERMKARLLLNNFPAVKVSKTTSSNGTWYRVRTGPFITFNKLKSALMKLNKLNITPMQIPLG
ncbi:MAG: SPOR domain-containing protein [Oceanospirillaceae bacterium]|nr:SPOR domain-containing protein [Oceanospirillaceae bacterium]